MWHLLEEGFTPKFGDDLHRLGDLYHLTEKLGAAAHVLEFARYGRLFALLEVNVQDESHTQHVQALCAQSLADGKPVGSGKRFHFGQRP